MVDSDLDNSLVLDAGRIPPAFLTYLNIAYYVGQESTH